MQAIFRLVEDDRLRAVDDAVGHFLAAMGRQAVHRPDIRAGQVEQGIVDGIAGERVAASLGLDLLAHRGPGVGVHDGRAGDDLARLPFAVGLSRKTRGIIRQNLWLSLGMVAVLVPATIAGLGIGPAVALHEGSTLVVVFNALRLLAYREG